MGANGQFDLVLETANTERLRITDDGKIGIGLVNPEGKLHILGDFVLNGSLKLPDFSDAGSEDKRFMYVDQGGTLRITGSDELLADFYRVDCKVLDGQPYPSPIWMSSSSPDAGILCTGQSCPARVGIGTDAPNTSLDVAGSIHGNRVFIGPIASIDNNYLLRVGTIQSQVFKPFLEVRNNSEFRLSFTEGAVSPFVLFNSPANKHYLKMNNLGSTEMNFFGTLDGEVIWSFRDGNNSDPATSDIAVLTSDGTW